VHDDVPWRFAERISVRHHRSRRRFRYASSKGSMIELAFPRGRRGRPLRVLCLGAHCDDIDIGCGATLLKLVARGWSAEVTWVVFSAPAVRARELHASAKRFLRRAAASTIITHEFRDSYFPAQYQDIKECFEPLKRAAPPDVIFTHRQDDSHQDHRLIAELTWNAFRDHLILEYEIPKYEGDLTPPNAFVRIDRSIVKRKIDILMSCYKTQTEKPWFSRDAFEAIMRLRGIEAGAPDGWAEGFHATKFCLD
jgi:LmbE family N-acetylglucosaminyl deacetylase